MTITTPALLFPAISLLLLAYTNRFAVLTKVIRDLSNEHDEKYHEIICRQINSLRRRLQLIRVMQMLGVFSFIVCTFSMLALFFGETYFGHVLFGVALVLLVSSLVCSLFEVQVSTEAINIELEKLDQGIREHQMGKQ